MRKWVLLFLCCTNLSYAPCRAVASATGEGGGMVVSEKRAATEVGVKILEAGGNAIDAAVAVGYALAVVDPCCGNIGGGGFMTIHLASGENIFLNFREKAPLRATHDMFLKMQNAATTNGYLAVGVPGTVLGFETILKKYGTLPQQQVLAPAIQLAEQGFIVTPWDANLFSQSFNDFKADPNVAAIFLHDGMPYKTGERLIQTNLANTLKAIAKDGAKAFYEGKIAQTILKASAEHQGILSQEDFKNYSVQFLKPIECNYRGYTIITAAPPSSGGVVLCEMLNILENFSLKHTARSTQIVIEAMRYGFNDRNNKLGDPDFVTNPVEELLSETYANGLSKKIAATISKPTEQQPLSNELPDTTHYSIVDQYGNAVSVTYTLNGYFGAKVIAGNTGFFLNNEMDDFATHPGQANKFGLVQQEPNTIAPGKRPLSSMTPTIVMKDGKVIMVVGSPGGPRIISSVLLTILNVLDYGMPIQTAVNKPRFHYQSEPDKVYIEPYALSPYTRLYLKMLGYHLQPQSSWSAVEAIKATKNGWSCANDIRRPAGACSATH